ncbi:MULTISPECIES: DivIVA domain-containing protein [Sporosarcina]|uniref:Cell division initiation protein n=1 Tax=Sporosarcina psychrophila TaxID=1476 RepID=A0ABV2K7P4_SPOPS|nr:MULTISPECIES: DivIVA domain-containing protein [Sporosarcina]AMQ07304.1 septum formation initiator [Sporosarcina psychrophila]QNK87024.1 DivIVA domain-containing protein [Sporosarcina sp. resist]
MALSPLDIHNKEFANKFRGYDEDEVNEFLEQIMKDFENILEENKTLKSNLKQSEEQVSHFNSIEQTLQKSILIAQEAAEDVRRNSMKESKLIVKEAEKNADRIVNEALSRARRISVEIEDLKKQSKVFRTRFKMLIEAQLDLIQSDDWDVLLEYEIDAERLEMAADLDS